MFFQSRSVRGALIYGIALFSGISSAFSGEAETQMAAALGVPVDGIFIECPQNTYSIKRDEKGQKATELKICLSPDDVGKRCEVTVMPLRASPATYKISLEMNVLAESPASFWYSVMQIHSFPDQGESWRCPPFSLEVVGQRFRAYSRWDTSPISRTMGNNCTETGSSLRGRDLLSGVPVLYNRWQQVELGGSLSPYNDGRLFLNINKWKSLRINGGNIFNDARSPFIKLGIYQPAGWDEKLWRSAHPVCVGYRNLKIVSSEVR